MFIFIPLKAENPTRRFPFITIWIIFINIYVFIYELTLNKDAQQAFIYKLGAIPFELTHFRNIPISGDISPVLTLFTSMFLHGGIPHIFSNMLFLWIFGNSIEDSMGHLKFFVFYLSCGIIALCAHTLSVPASLTPMIGASGAIAGVMGAYFWLFPYAKVTTFVWIIFYIALIKIHAFFFLGIWIISQALSARFALLNSGTGAAIAWYAHIGGFLAGILLLNWFRKK